MAMTNEKAKAFLTYQNRLKKAVRDIEEEFGGKVAEQELISVLFNANWYFHEEFTPDEISRMQYNIASDFPIFLETHIGDYQHRLEAYNNECNAHLAAIDTMNTRIDDQDKKIKGLRSRLNTILHHLICAEVSGDSCINSALGQFSSYEVIMEKLNQGIALNAEELKIVKSKITNDH